MTFELYLLRADGWISYVERLAAQNEAKAVRQIEHHDHPHWVELWFRGRLIGRFPPKHQS